MALYAVILVAAELIAWRSLRGGLPRVFYLIEDGRANDLVRLALASTALERAAVASLPLLVLGLVLARTLADDPLEALGLRLSFADLLSLPAACLIGFHLHAGLLLVVSLLARDSLVPADPLRYTIEIVVYHAWRTLAGGWALVVYLLAASFAFALARVVISHGLVWRQLAERWPAAGAAGVAALVFAFGYAFSPFLTPLAGVNILLAGLALERVRARWGNLWGPLGLLMGWVLFGLIVPHRQQGLPGPTLEPLAGLPVLFSGGTYGPEGGLAMTMLLLLGLGILLRSPAQPDLPTILSELEEEDDDTQR